MVIRLGMFFLLALSLLFSATSWSAVRVYVDRDPVQVNESFRVTYETDHGNGDPDFSPLEKDFEILSRSQNSSIQIINGNMSRKAEWELVLMARSSGAFELPEISFGNERSPTAVVNVRPDSQSSDPSTRKDLYLDVEVDKSIVYVQAQVKLTVRLFRSIRMGNNATLTEPQLSDGDAVIKKIGDDGVYEKYIDGDRYIIVERNYLIFPQQSGVVQINPLMFEGKVATRSGTMRVRRIHSQALHLTVNPVPASAGRPWLPATRVELSDAWGEQNQAFMVGEPVTRTLTLKVEGLTAAQLPELDGDDTDGIKRYPDQPVLEEKIGSSGMVSTRQEKRALIPTQSGKLTLPAVEVTWWNTTEDRLEVARLPERTIQVQAAADQPSTVVQTQMEQGDPSIRHVPLVQSPRTVITNSKFDIWFWVSLLLACGWLITVLIWWRQVRTPIVEPGAHSKPIGIRLHTLKKDLKRACQNGDAKAANRVLIQWANHQWPVHSPMNLNQIAERVGGEFGDSLSQLNDHLYGSSRQSWNAIYLLEQYLKYVGSKSEKPVYRESQLPRLTRLAS